MTRDEAIYACDTRMLVVADGITNHGRREAMRIKKVNDTPELTMRKDGSVRDTYFCIAYRIHSRSTISIAIDRLERW